MTKYWIATISKEHILRGVAGSFIQVCHGKQAPLRRMSKGDYIIVYSSKIAMTDNKKYQQFTAIGQVMDEDIYQYHMTEDFNPFRRKIQFMAAKECAIIPLIGELDFIQNKQKWGYPFRFGLFEISQKDYQLIASRMTGSCSD